MRQRQPTSRSATAVARVLWSVALVATVCLPPIVAQEAPPAREAETPAGDNSPPAPPEGERPPPPPQPGEGADAGKTPPEGGEAGTPSPPAPGEEPTQPETEGAPPSGEEPGAAAEGAEGAPEPAASDEAPEGLLAEAAPEGEGGEAPERPQEGATGPPPLATPVLGGEEATAEPRLPAPPASETTEAEQKAARRAEAKRRRAQAKARRQAAISASLEALREEPSAARDAPGRATLITQVAQAAQVEIGALREQLAGARLERERLRSLHAEVGRDRREIPPAVRDGSIPTLGGAERWDSLQGLSGELQTLLDEVFAARLKLLAETPSMESDAELGKTVLRAAGEAAGEDQRQILHDAADNLVQRLAMTRELMAIYNDQAELAAQAYDEVSHFSEELSDALVQARRHGLQARAPSGITRQTVADLVDDVGRCKELPAAIAEEYRSGGRPFLSAGDAALRGAAILLILTVLAIAWGGCPRWIRRWTEARLRDKPSDST